MTIFSSRDALTDGAKSDPSVAKTYRYETETGDLTHLADLDRPPSSTLPQESEAPLETRRTMDNQREEISCSICVEVSYFRYAAKK